jgi:flagellar secretion chaperone FliS
MAHANAIRARSRYQELDLAGKLDGATPHALVAILYAELLQSLDVMMSASRQGRLDTSRHHTERCRTILIALGGSLDFDRGGDLARSLASVYRSMTMELQKAPTNAHPERLQGVRDGVVSLATAWGQLAAT